MSAQPIRYARSGDIQIAYQVVGDGPLDLVMAMGAFTNLEVLWELPEYRRLCESVGSFARLLLFDKRGMGLSDRVRFGTLEELTGDAVRGIAVHTGARVAAQAGAGEVLVSQTVKDLVAGPAIEFEDRGARELKGIPGEWRLYAVSQS